MNDTQSPQAGSGKVEVTLLDILKLLLSKSYWLLLAGVLGRRLRLSGHDLSDHADL